MAKPSKNETDMLDLINKIQTQLIGLEKKIDTLISRPLAQTAASPKTPVNTTNFAARPNDHHKERTMHTAICADCKKECSIPFKPSGDRPVYCQDCFSRRKVIRLSGINVDEKPPMNTPQPQAKQKKKAVAVKKAAARKKTVPKKK